MASTRPAFAWTSLVLTAGAVVFLFFIVLGGTANRNPLYQIYFLKADTSSIPGAPKAAQWTLWNVCDGVGTGRDYMCSGIRPAYPFDPPRNFRTTVNIDSGFVGTNMFYYLSRSAFAFYLISLIFAVFSFFTGFLALCSRLGSAVSSLFALTALLFTTLAATLMTSCFVMGRNYFIRNKQPARLGVKAFGFTWGAFACLFLSTVLFCLTCVAGRRETTYTPATRGRGGLWDRKSSTRSKRSFMDTRQMRKEYN